MKINQRLLNQFNREETVIVISTYPRRGQTYDPKALAVAPFTKNKINALAKQAKRQGRPLKFVVLADAIEGEQVYLENNHLIVRCWTRNLLSVYLALQKVIFLFPKTSTVLIEHEFGIFGLKHQITAQLPLFLLINRLLGKKIILVLHQVIFDLGQLSGHLQISPDSLYTKILNRLIQLNFYLFGQLANQLVVFEPSLKEKLSRLVNQNKISIIPLGNHGKGQFTNRHKKEIKKRLGLDQNSFYLLFAGYVTWYKGADWLVKTFSYLKKHFPRQKIKLLIAGGQSSSLEIDTKYLNWYNRLFSQIKKNPDIEITGVLPEKTLPTYIAAADLMVLPYRLMMSASGPFTIAQSTNTPAVVSSHLWPMFNGEDIRLAKHQTQTTNQDLLFSYQPKGLAHLIKRALSDKNYLPKLRRFMACLQTQRSPISQAPAYLSLLPSLRTKDFSTAAKPAFA